MALLGSPAPQATSKNIRWSAENDSCYIINFEGKILNITELVVEFSIYENLYSHYLTGSIVLFDSNGILEKLPMIGEEQVQIKVQTVEQRNIDYFFSTYKIEKVQTISDNNRLDSMFTIQLVSPYLISSNQTSINKAFIGKSCSEIIKNIHESYFEKNKFTHTEKNLNYLVSSDIDVEETDGLISIVSCDRTPFDLIQYCVKNSRSLKYPDSDFVFYQDSDGFKLRSISNLMEKDSVEDYFVGSAEKSTSFKANEYEINDYQYVSSWERSLNYDIIKRQKQGMYNNTVISIDPILKRYKEQNLKYVDPEVRFKHNTDREIKFNTEKSVYKEGSPVHTRYMVSNISDKIYRDESYLKDKIIVDNEIRDITIAYPSERYKMLNKRISKMSQLKTGLKLNISVPGNSELIVGQNINFHFPQTTEATDRESNTQENFLFGREKNAKFLIVALNHLFNVTSKQFYTNLTIVKNEFGSVIQNRS